MSNWLAFLRSSVRPVLAYLFSITFSVLVVILALRFASEDIARILIIGFSNSVSLVIGLYFGSRQNRGVNNG